MHTAFALLFALQATPACGWSSMASYSVSRTSTARMGLFDQIAKAFQNEEFKEDDQRVRASHIWPRATMTWIALWERWASLANRWRRSPTGSAPYLLR